jgi:hypothetical protein
MQVTPKSGLVDINVAPIITIPGLPATERTTPDIELVLKPEGVLPEGRYEVEVILRGADGTEQKAITHVVVSHIH